MAPAGRLPRSQPCSAPVATLPAAPAIFGETSFSRIRLGPAHDLLRPRSAAGSGLLPGRAHWPVLQPRLRPAAGGDALLAVADSGGGGDQSDGEQVGAASAGGAGAVPAAALIRDLVDVGVAADGGAHDAGCRERDDDAA